MSTNVNISRVSFPSDLTESSKIFNAITNIGEGIGTRIMPPTQKATFQKIIETWSSVVDPVILEDIHVSTIGFTFYYMGKRYIVAAEFFTDEEFKNNKPEALIKTLKEANYPVEDVFIKGTTQILNYPEPETCVFMSLYEQLTDDASEFVFFFSKNPLTV